MQTVHTVGEWRRNGQVKMKSHLVVLKEVNVNDSRPKNTLAEQGLLITSARDLRLKTFNYREWIAKILGAPGAPPSNGAPASQMAR